VIKLILGFGTRHREADDVRRPRLEFKAFKLRADPSCPVCGTNPTITAPIDYEQFCGVPALDPKSLEETQREVIEASSPRGRRPRPGRDWMRAVCRRGTHSSRIGRSLPAMQAAGGRRRDPDRRPRAA